MSETPVCSNCVTYSPCSLRALDGSTRSPTSSPAATVVNVERPTRQFPDGVTIGLYPLHRVMHRVTSALLTWLVRLDKEVLVFPRKAHANSSYSQRIRDHSQFPSSPGWLLLCWGGLEVAREGTLCSSRLDAEPVKVANSAITSGLVTSILISNTSQSESVSLSHES
jgi:hypothetical protein